MRKDCIGMSPTTNKANKIQQYVELVSVLLFMVFCLVIKSILSIFMLGNRWLRYVCVVCAFVLE
jgi:hypothetical protein